MRKNSYYIDHPYNSKIANYRDIFQMPGIDKFIFNSF